MSEPIKLRPQTNNRILDALPDEDYFRLEPLLENIKLPLSQVLYKSDEIIKYVYFPINAMASVVAMTFDGECAEVGVIGREGMVGIDVLLGVDSSTKEVLIQLSDGAFRIKTEEIRKEFKKAGALHDLTLRFVHCFIEQISQTALCNRLHSLEERLARWLLMCHDRAENDDLSLTQEFLSIMLGTNRPSVTIAAINLQSAGFIKYSRGKIAVIDREGLEDFSCACYRTVQEVYSKMPTSIG